MIFKKKLKTFFLSNQKNLIIKPPNTDTWFLLYFFVLHFSIRQIHITIDSLFGWPCIKRHLALSRPRVPVVCHPPPQAARPPPWSSSHTYSTPSRKLPDPSASTRLYCSFQAWRGVTAFAPKTEEAVLSSSHSLKGDYLSGSPPWWRWCSCSLQGYYSHLFPLSGPSPSLTHLSLPSNNIVVLNLKSSSEIYTTSVKKQIVEIHA